MAKDKRSVLGFDATDETLKPAPGCRVEKVTFTPPGKPECVAYIMQAETIEAAERMFAALPEANRIKALNQHVTYLAKQDAARGVNVESLTAKVLARVTAGELTADEGMAEIRRIMSAAAAG